MFGDKIYPNSLVMADKFGAGYCQVTFVFSVKSNFEMTKKRTKIWNFLRISTSHNPLSSTWSIEKNQDKITIRGEGRWGGWGKIPAESRIILLKTILEEIGVFSFLLYHRIMHRANHSLFTDFKLLNIQIAKVASSTFCRHFIDLGESFFHDFKDAMSLDCFAEVNGQVF